MESLYNRFLFPEGIKGMAEAVNLIAEGKAPRVVQSEEGASYEGMLNKKESSMLKIDELTGEQLHNFIRGCDKVPGAWIKLDDQEIKLYGSQRWTKDVPNGLEVQVLGEAFLYFILNYLAYFKNN